MEVVSLEIPEVKLIRPKRFADSRGWFSETYTQRLFAEHGIPDVFVQDNHSLSVHAGTVRALHFQSPPHATLKLIRALAGAILDVVVDIRRGSPTYGRHVSVELRAGDGQQVLVPIGFAHGFSTLEPNTEVAYKVTDYYAPACDRGIIWNDPDLAIDWRLPPTGAVMSERDGKHPRFRDCPTYFTYA